MSPVKTVVISCAGIGSRLGLGTTKALIDINGKTLIHWQLSMLKDVDDVRVVVGFQAKEVIEEVLKVRKDVIFVYNHNYFETKTGSSYYLGSRYGQEYVMELDGDLLVHPDDMKKCLDEPGEFIAYSDITSDDAVYVKLNKKGEVVQFSIDGGDYEWTGPACLSKHKIVFKSSNIYNQLEDHLPIKGIKIKACDVDTHNDYLRAVEFVKKW